MTTSERAQQQQQLLSRDDNLQRLLLEEVQKSGFVTAAGYKAVLQKVLHTNAVAKNANAAAETSISASHPSRDVTMAMVGESHPRMSETSSSLSTHNNNNNDRSKQQNNNHNNNRRRPARSMIRDSMFGSMIKSNLSTMSVSSSLTASNFSNSLLSSSSVTASNLSGSLSFSKRGSLGGGSSIIGSNNKHNVYNNVRASNLRTCTFEDFIEEQVVFPVPYQEEDVTKNKNNVTASILLSANNTNNLAPRRRRSDYSVTSIEQDVMATSSNALQETESSFTRRKNGSSREGRQGSCRRSRLIKLISVKFDDPQEKEEEDNYNNNTSQDDTPGTSRNNVDDNKAKQRMMKKKMKQHKKKVVPTEVTTTTTMNNSDPSFFMNSSDTNLDSKEFDPQAFINNLVCSSRSDQKLTARDINLKLKKSGSEKWLPWPSASKRHLLRREDSLSKRSSMQSSFSSYDVEEEEEEDGNNYHKSSSFRTANDDCDDAESGNSEEWLAWPEDQGSSSRSLLQEVASSIRARAA